MIIDAEKYNLLRLALVNNETEEHDIVTVPPKTFALRKEHDERVLKAAMSILEDPRIVDGITPHDTMTTFQEEDLNPEVVFYILVCYAVAVQQQWITYSILIQKYVVNMMHKDARQFVEDTHKTILH